MHIRIGTRGSKLALAQADIVKNALLKIDPEITIKIIPIKTSGDIMLDENLALIGGKGLFLKEIEEQLIDNKIDIAVHSMKDVPAELPKKLIINCVLEREDVRDVFISAQYNSLEELPEGATVGTSSSRRKVQVLKLRPDLEVIPFRGNITTRIKKIEKGKADATILALAGLKRINMESEAKKILSTDDFLPAVAQGAIGVESREGDDEIIELLAQINHQETLTCITAERGFLKGIEGDCTTPLAAHAVLDGDQVKLKAMLAVGEIKEVELSGHMDDAEELGLKAAGMVG